MLRSAVPLGGYPPSVLASLRRWAEADPDYPLIAERDAGGGWRSGRAGRRTGHQLRRPAKLTRPLPGPNRTLPPLYRPLPRLYRTLAPS